MYLKEYKVILELVLTLGILAGEELWQ